jgi:mono/diheme cytochrome c family protein
MNISISFWATLTILAVTLPTIGCGGGSSDPVSQGKSLAAANCKTCHDPGDGSYSGSTKTVAVGHQIFGKNLTPDPQNGIGSWTDAQVVAAIKTGVAANGSTLCSVMPRWAGMLSDEEINDIVAFLRTLPAVAKATPASTCDI